MTLNMTKAVLVAGLVAMVMMFVGCESKPKTWVGNIEVAPGGNLAGKLGAATLEVDLVAVTDVEAQKWAGRDLNSYFAMGSGERADAHSKGTAYPMLFGAGNGTGAKTLVMNDKIWAEWQKRKVTQLFVVANSAAATKSPNSFQMPLTSDRIKVRTFQIQVDSADIGNLSPIEPPKQ